MSSSCYELLIGSSNPGKVREIKLALDALPLMLRSLDQYSDLSAPIECGASYADNAIIKATDYARQTGMCVLADDSGLEVDWLDGSPGLHSARFGEGSDADRVKLLLEKLKGALNGTRRARFVSVVAIVHPTIGVINVAEGECRGRISDTPLGNNGFGYDPVFIPDGYELTFGQLTNEVKAGISHRAKSLALSKAFLGELLTTA